MRLGVFGGTFDPPHVGHLVAAQEVFQQLALDRLLLLPAAAPPHKQDRAVTAPELRLEMLTAAVAGDPRFEVSDLELRRPGPSYTVHTLRELVTLHPDADLFLALGADQAAELDGWREPGAIRELATLVAFARSGEPVPADVGNAVRRVDVPMLDVSSTDIRRRVAEGRPIRYLVPEAVEAIIRRESLWVEPGVR